LNKKLRLLGNLESDHDGDSNGDGNDDDTGKMFHILQEVAAYLGPTVLTEEEKMSAVLYWKRFCEAYPHLSQIAKIYLTLSASSVPVESMFSLAGLVKTRVAHLCRIVSIVSVAC